MLSSPLKSTVERTGVIDHTRVFPHSREVNVRNSRIPSASIVDGLDLRGLKGDVLLTFAHAFKIPDLAIEAVLL